MFNGKKTYMTVIVAIVYAVSAVVLGEWDLNQAIGYVLPMLSLGFLRHGVATGGLK